MPTHQSVPVCDNDSFGIQYDETSEQYDEDRCLLLLREKEIMAYHHICGVFRAQGHLTREKLKLLKELASILSIPEVRHKAECRLAVNNRELNIIAECVAGPYTDAQWRIEAHGNRDRVAPRVIDSASLQLADAVAKAIREAMNDPPDPKTGLITKTVYLRSIHTVNNEKKESKESQEDPNIDIKDEMPDIKIEDETKESDKEGELSSSVSTTSEPPEDIQSYGEEEKTSEVEKEAKHDSDAILMPPPPVTTVIPVSSNSPTSVITAPPTSIPASVVNLPTSPTVITVPPSSSIPTLPTTPAVITVPPSSSILTLSPPHPAVITVPPSTSLSDISTSSGTLTMSIPSSTLITTSPGILTTPPLPTSCEIDECTPVLSEDLQFVSFSEAMDVSLPSLVVVPPPEPVITVPHSSSFSPSSSTPTLVIPSGMSFQFKEEGEDLKKRKRAITQDSGNASGPSPKTMAISQIAKVGSVIFKGGSLNGINR